MDSGNPLVETWIPDGGFRIERRKVKTPDGGSALAFSGVLPANEETEFELFLTRLDRPSRNQTKGIRRISPRCRPFRPVYPLLTNLSKIMFNNSIFQRVKRDDRHAASRFHIRQQPAKTEFPSPGSGSRPPAWINA